MSSLDRIIISVLFFMAFSVLLILSHRTTILEHAIDAAIAAMVTRDE